MRIVLIGASPLAVNSATELVAEGHQVVVIEKDKQRADELSLHLDCAFLHGDGSLPDLLREADPGHTDILMCLTNHDQTNIIAGLAAKSLGYGRVVIVIQEEDYEALCSELGLTETLIPLRYISRQLTELTKRHPGPVPEEVIKHDAIIRSVHIGTGGIGTEQLGLPKKSRVVAFYRGEALMFPEPDTVFDEDDELVILAPEGSGDALDRRLDELNEQWRAQ
jgi:trk system potassium uptake protein TrkA